MAEQLPNAARIINSRILDDTLPPLYTFTPQGTSAANSYTVAPSLIWSPFVKKESHMMPDAVLDEINIADGKNNGRASIGVFKEVQRAYVTSEKQIWFWDWKDPENLHVFDQVDDTIANIGLVLPKPGLFVDTIKHLLVVSTLTSVTLFGLALVPSEQKPGRNDLAIYLTNLSVPTYGLTFSSFTSTSNGRIFCVGSKGHLHEIDYRSHETFTRKQCEVIDWTNGGVTNNPRYSLLQYFSPTVSVAHSGSVDDRIECRVDSGRGFVYCLQRGNSIEMYNISTQSGSLDANPELRVKLPDLCREVARSTPNSVLLDTRTCRLISFDVIVKEEAGDSSAALVAYTNTGVRLYLSHRLASTSLQLHHVRLPPSLQAFPSSVQSIYPSNQNRNSPQGLVEASPFPFFDNIGSAACFKNGFFFAATADHPDPLNTCSQLIAVAPDVGRILRNYLDSRSTPGMTNAMTLMTTSQISTQLSEFITVLGIEGSVWAIEDISPPTSVFETNELASQIFDHPREFLVVTNMGTTLLEHQRPIDVLWNLLNSGLGVTSPRDNDLQTFYENFGRDQTCAMCLCIAAGVGILTPTKSKKQMDVAPQRPVSQDVINSAKRLLYEVGGHASSFEKMYSPKNNISHGSMLVNNKITFSGRHEALAICMSRLLKPVWKELIVKTSTSGQVVNNVPEQTLMRVQLNLGSLLAFVERDWQLFGTPTHPRRGQLEHDATVLEQQSLSSLRLLLKQAVEGIAFTLLLIDYQLANIIQASSESTKLALLALSYENLLTSEMGRDVARTLVNVIINQQINQQQSIDAISEVLQQRCGSFCSSQDVFMFKALESLRRADSSVVQAEKHQSLHEALKLLLKTTSHLSYDKLVEICAQFSSLHFPTGTIDLALACAHQWDPDNKGFQFWQEGGFNGIPGQELLKKRESCYALVTTALQNVEKDKVDAMNATRKVNPDKSEYNLEQVIARRDNAFSRALNSDDECFHHYLYGWYLQQDLADQLLRVRSPYIEVFLRRNHHLELLWRYYVENACYFEAATVLSDLADSDLPLSLASRIEYLSLALGNAKSRSPAPTDTTKVIDLVQLLEEKLEVAQVQLGVVRALQDSQELNISLRTERLSQLNERLFSISELYNEFALPLDLYEIQLIIFNVSEYDGQETEAIYDIIFDRVQDKGSEAIALKFSELGRLLYPATFPLGSILMRLEQFAFHESSQNSQRPHWPIEALLAAMIPHEHIFKVLDDMWRCRATPFGTALGISYLTDEVTFLIEKWILHGSNVYAADILTAVERYLMNLSSMVGAVNQGMVQRLKDIQSRIGSL